MVKHKEVCVTLTDAKKWFQFTAVECSNSLTIDILLIAVMKTFLVIEKLGAAQCRL